MSRRVRLPDADDLFRPTVVPDPPAGAPAPAAPARPAGPEPGVERPARASGRVKHDEKVTVYVTADELLDLENARLALRRHHGLAVDRGRLVREAVALALADLEAQGADSPLVRRLSDG